MSVELNSEHVINFALQPVGGRPDRDARRDGSAVGDLRLHAYPLIARERIEYPYDVELLFALRIMRCGDIDTVVELLFVAQQAQDVGDQGAVGGKVVRAEISEGLEARAVLAAVFFNHRRGPRHRYGTSGLGGSGRLCRRGGFRRRSRLRWLGGRRCGFFRRRLLLTFRRRWWSRRFDFLGHSGVYRYKSRSIRKLSLLTSDRVTVCDRRHKAQHDAASAGPPAGLRPNTAP